MPLNKSQLHFIYHNLLEAQAIVIESCEAIENEDTHHLSDNAAALEGRIEAISTILATTTTNHTH